MVVRAFILGASVSTLYRIDTHPSTTFRRLRMVVRSAKTLLIARCLLVGPLPPGKRRTGTFREVVDGQRSSQRSEKTSAWSGTANFMSSKTSSVRLFCWTLSSITIRVGNWRPPNSFTSDIDHTFNSMPDNA